MRQKVFAYIRQHNMIEENDKVIVGVSGGADSMCLLLMLREYRNLVPFEIKVVHIEHGVRGEESRKDAEFVQKMCDKWGIICITRSFDVPALAKEWKISVEEAGRRIRYGIFSEIGQAWGKYKIAVAHNRNDQAETMLWNMARGSGLNGAGGIRPMRGQVIRPLLSSSRKDIEAYLVEHKVFWCEDSTNQEAEYTRNCIRQHILPVMEQELNSQTTEHLAMLGNELQRVEAFLERLAAQVMERAVQISEGKAEIQIDVLAKEELLIRERVIRKSLEYAGCTLKDLGRIHVEQIQNLCLGQSGRKIHLPGGWMAEKNFTVLCLKRENETDEQPKEILEQRIFLYNQENIPQKKYTKWFDYDKIQGKLCLRYRLPGDYLVIDQKGSRKKLKAYFIEEKIPANERAQVLLAAVDSEILWVVGHRISEAYKVQSDTKRVLELKVQGRDK